MAFFNIKDIKIHVIIYKINLLPLKHKVDLIRLYNSTTQFISHILILKWHPHGWLALIFQWQNFSLAIGSWKQKRHMIQFQNPKIQV